MYSGNEALVRYQLQCLKPAPQRLRIRDSPILPAFIHTCSTLFSVCHWNLPSRNSNKSFILTTIKKNCVWVCKLKGFLNDSVVKESACQCRRYKRCRFCLWVRKIPGGGNDIPHQYSCLKNPMDTGAWWATIHSVSKSQTRLKRLSTHTCMHM